MHQWKPRNVSLQVLQQAWSPFGWYYTPDIHGHSRNATPPITMDMSKIFSFFNSLPFSLKWFYAPRSEICTNVSFLYDFGPVFDNSPSYALLVQNRGQFCRLCTKISSLQSVYLYAMKGTSSPLPYWIFSTMTKKLFECELHKTNHLCSSIECIYCSSLLPRFLTQFLVAFLICTEFSIHKKHTYWDY